MAKAVLDYITFRPDQKLIEWCAQLQRDHAEVLALGEPLRRLKHRPIPVQAIARLFCCWMRCEYLRQRIEEARPHTKAGRVARAFALSLGDEPTATMH